jgi:uncharacterized protein (DUF1330 family)
MTALMISTIEVTDPASFQDYMMATQKVAGPYGAKLLFRGKLDAMLSESDRPGPLVVVVSFPDIETLHRWNASPEYQDLIPLRDKSSVQTMTAYQALA